MLSHYEQVEIVFVFGSRTRGNFRPGSDIDLAIKGKNCTADAIPFHKTFAKPYELAVLAKRLVAPGFRG